MINLPSGVERRLVDGIKDRVPTRDLRKRFGLTLEQIGEVARKHNLRGEKQVAGTEPDIQFSESATGGGVDTPKSAPAKRPPRAGTQQSADAIIERNRATRADEGTAGSEEPSPKPRDREQGDGDDESHRRKQLVGALAMKAWVRRGGAAAALLDDATKLVQLMRKRGIL